MEKENTNIVQINEEMNVVKYETKNIKDLIYTIRGKQVMLDSDVAMLYHCETRNINQAVKRNIDRFPDRYCFQLTRSEFENLNNGKVIRKYLPYVFTEQGIAMLSGLLKNEIAIQVSINIMDAFVEMRKIIANNFNINSRVSTLEYQMIECHEKFDEVFNELQKGKDTEFNQKIFFDGQIYDAYSLIIDIIKRAKEKILIIDNYIDDNILKMLAKKNKNVDVVILTSQNCNLTKLDINKFNKQYPTLIVARTSKFHDRFIVIDNKELYHCGASLKDLGKKCFAISKMKDTKFMEIVS